MSLFGSQYYNQTLRRYIVMFGNMFNDMVVQRLAADNTVVQTIGVPLTYSPKEKYLARLEADPNLDRPVAVQLPSISFEMTNMTYDGARRLSSVTKNVAHNATDADRIRSQYVPVPYNMTFMLYIYTRNADDAAQLLEQIIPFFGPEWTNSVNLIPSMGITMDVPTILNSISSEDSYEGDFMTRRALIHTLDFTVKGYYFGPVRTSGVIKRTQVDLGIVAAQSNTNVLYGIQSTSISDADVARTGRSSRVVLTPGLLANGSPTTNSAASISRSLISANSNYGLAANTFVYTDGKKYDPVSGTDNLRIENTQTTRFDLPN